MLTIPKEVKHILVAPLNWGLGHASRCIPIIDELLERNYLVTIASDGEALKFLNREFPNLPSLELPAYKVKYKTNNLFSIVIENIPNVFFAILKEKKALSKILARHKIDLVISDSRFGFYSRKKHSIIISHQLNLLSKNPILSFFLNSVNRFFLNSFDECWVPDYSDRRLSGKLSDPKFVKSVEFIGPLSSLKKYETEKIYDIGIVLSGPEPARTKWEEKLVKKYSSKNVSIALIRGTDEAKPIVKKANWTIISLATRKEVNRILLESKHIISRSGYTSVMDYDHLGIEAELVATPGQSEQEYLSALHANLKK